MRRTMSCLSTAVICGSVCLLGACTDTGVAPSGTAAAPRGATSSGSGPWAVATLSDEHLQQALLSQEDVAAAIGASATGIRVMTSSEASGLSRALTWWGCADAVDSSGPSGSSGPWKAGAFYQFLLGDREGDVVECITTADLLTLEDVQPSAAGTDTVLVESDGGGGAIDRAVFVEDDGVLILVVANLHSPVPEGQNLTRAQVDRLVAVAVDNVDAEALISQFRGNRHGKGGFPGSEWP